MGSHSREVGDKMWLTPEVKEHLLYWKNPRDSGIAFGSVLVILFAVKYVSIISVVANLGLVTSTMAFRIYESVLSAVNKAQDGHPFKQYLDFDVTLPVDQVSNLAVLAVRHLNLALSTSKSAIMCENVVLSVKFAAGMYGLTYIGRWFNGSTVVMAVWIFLFSAPKVYRDNQEKIDEALKPIKEKVDEVLGKVMATADKKQD